MITKIAIENFKGIGDRIEVPMRPITLLFGGNSAGKSSILHALHYAREILERLNLDANHTLSGGEFIELGGFTECIHKHDINRSIVIRIDFDISKGELNDYLTQDLYLNHFEVTFENESYALGSIYYHFDDVLACSVELVVSYSSLLKKPYLSRYSTTVNGESLADINYKAGDSHATIANLNLKNTGFNVYADYDVGKGITINLAESAIARCGGAPLSKKDGVGPIQFESTMGYGALPNLHGQLFLQSVLPEIPTNEVEDVSAREYEVNWNFRLRDDRYIAGMTLSALLTQYLIGPGVYARDYLNKLCYVGPLRIVPSKEYVAPSHFDDSRWATGLAAWDLLSSAENSDLVQCVSEWLNNEDKLNTGYILESTPYQEIPQTLGELMLRAEDADDPELEVRDRLAEFPILRRVYLHDILRDTKVAPANMGIGISQVIPVIASVFSDRTSLIQIEQPALHLHPTQQAAVGDLFIEGAMGSLSKQIVAETHSIPLILRILRRMRHSSQKDKRSDIEITPNSIVILYIEAQGKGVDIHEVLVGEDGELLQPWPDAFFDQDYKERFS